MAFILFQSLGFASPADPDVSNAVKALRNLEFMTPTTIAEVQAVQSALKLLETKLKTTDPNSSEGKHLLEVMGRNLCPKKDGKPTESDVYSALLSLEAKAKDFKSNVSYSNTNFMESLIGSKISDLSSQNAQKAKLSRQGSV